MAKKKKEECPPAGAPAWMATYGDMVTLLLCFFVLLFSMSSVDVAKFKAAMSSFADQIDVMPGGEALTDGDLLDNGISQLNDIVVVFQGAMAWDTEGDESITPNENENEDESSADNEDNQEQEIDPYELAGKIAEEFEEIIQDEGVEASVAISFSANYVKFTLQGEFLFDSGRANLKDKAKDAIAVIADIGKESKYEGYDVEIAGHTDNLSINSVQFPNNWILSNYRAYAVLEEMINVHGYDPERIAATGYGEYRPLADNDTIEGRAANRRVEIKVLLNTEELTTEEYTTEQIEDGFIDEQIKGD